MATILRSHYVLAVADLPRACRWFELVLGCRAEEVDPGNWVFMARDGVAFMLGRCPDAIPAKNLGDHQYFAYVVVDDVDAFHEIAAAHIEEAGGAIIKPPRDEAWGMREMALRMEDGHRMMIATRIVPPERGEA